jgi:hypothetical protein
LWHKEDAFVLCNNDGLQKYSAATGIRHDPKTLSTDMMGDCSPPNHTDPLRKESDQLNSKGVSFSESTAARSEYMSIGRIKDGSTANPSLDISGVDAGSIPATELSGPSSFLILGHDNKTSSTGHLRSVLYGREADSVDINAERINSNVEMTDEDAEKYSGVLEKPLKLDMDNESAGNCTGCCGTVQNGETGAVGPVTVLPSDSARNLTAQDSTVRSGIAASGTRDKQNSGPLHNTVCSVTLPSRDKTPSFMPDGVKYSAENLNPTCICHFPKYKKTISRKEFIVLRLGALLLFLVTIFVFTFAEEPDSKAKTPMYRCPNLLLEEKRYV